MFEPVVVHWELPVPPPAGPVGPWIPWGPVGPAGPVTPVEPFVILTQILSPLKYVEELGVPVAVRFDIPT